LLPVGCIDAGGVFSAQRCEGLTVCAEMQIILWAGWAYFLRFLNFLQFAIGQS